MTITEIERRIGKSFSDITIDDLKNLMEDKELLSELNDPENGIAIAEKVLTTNLDEDVRSQFVPLKYHHLLYNSEIKLSQVFAQFNVDKDKSKLVSELESFLKGATPLGKMSAYLVILTSFEDYNLKEKEEDIKASVKDVELILYSLDIEKAFPLVCDVIDMLYAIQTEYYSKYSIDVIAEDAEKLNEYIKKLTDFTQPIYDQMQKELEEKLPENSKPEEAGLLDITKFKDKED